MYGEGEGSADNGLGESSAAARLSSQFGRKLQHYLDKAAPHTSARWVAAAVLTALYGLRVYVRRERARARVRGGATSRAARPCGLCRTL
jgi:phage baseplate assembly protein W